MYSILHICFFEFVSLFLLIHVTIKRCSKCKIQVFVTLYTLYTEFVFNQLVKVIIPTTQT